MTLNPEIARLGPNAWAKLSAPVPAAPTIANGGKRVACHQWMVDGDWVGGSYVPRETTRNVPYFRVQSGIQYGLVSGRPTAIQFGGSHVGYPGNDVELCDLITGVWTQQYTPESPMLYIGLVTATDGISKITISSTAPTGSTNTSGRPTVDNAFQRPNVIAFGQSPNQNEGLAGPDVFTPYAITAYNGTTGEVTISGTFTGRQPVVGWTVAIWHSIGDWRFGSGFQNSSISPLARPYTEHTQDYTTYDPVTNSLLGIFPCGTMRYNLTTKTWGYLSGPLMQGGPTTSPNSDIAHRALLEYDPDLAALGNSGFQALVTDPVFSTPGKWLMSATGTWTQRTGANTATLGLPPEVAFNSTAQIQTTYCPSLHQHLVQFYFTSGPLSGTQYWYLYAAVTDVWTKLNGTPTARMGLAWDNANGVAISVDVGAPFVEPTLYVVDVSTDPVTIINSGAMPFATQHPTNLAGASGVTVNLLKYDAYHGVTLFVAPVNGVTGSGGTPGNTYELWAYCYAPLTPIAVQDWATRSTASGVVLALKAEDIYDAEVNPALPVNTGDFKGFFGASYPDNPPVLDTAVKASGTASFKFTINTNLRPAELRIPFTGPPATNGRAVGQRIPRLGALQPAGTFSTQFGAGTAGGDGSGGVGQLGGGQASRFYVQYRLRYDARAVKGYAGGAPSGGGGNPRLPIASLTWSGGTATMTVTTADWNSVPAGTKTPLVVGGVTPSGYNSANGIPVIMTKQSSSAGTLIMTYPLASNPGSAGSGGFMYEPSPGLKQYILYSQPNDTHGSYSSNTNLGLVQSSDPKYFPAISTTEPRLLLGAYIGPGGGNTVGANTRQIAGISYDQYPNDIGTGPHVQQPGGVAQTPPYFVPPEDEWQVINLVIENPHWHRAPGGGNAVPAYSRIQGLLCDNGKGGYGYLNSPDPIGTTAPDKIVRSSGSWVTDGVSNGAVFGVRGTGITTAFYRVTNTTTLTLTVERVSQAGVGSSPGLPTIAARTSTNVSNGTLVLLPAGTVTVSGSAATLTVPCALTDTDVIPVTDFVNQDQDGPMTYVALNTDGYGTPALTQFGILTALSVDKKTVTLKNRTGGAPALTNGLIYGIGGISRSWRDGVCEMWWSRDGGPRRLLFDAKWKGPNGESSDNDRLGCQMWQEEPAGMFGLLNILAYYNGINPDYGASSDGHMWADEIIVSTNPIADPPAAGASAPTPVLPVANFTGTPLSGTSTLTVQFTDQSTNTPTSWLWNFGDSQTSNAQHPSHLYAAPGTYSVTLTATNGAGSSTPVTRTNYVTVATPSVAPTANFTGSPLSGRTPLTVQFTDSSTASPTSWAWDFGDGGTSTSQHPSHTYAAAGTYSVTLTATNATGSDALMRTNYVTAQIPPSGRSKKLRIRL